MKVRIKRIDKDLPLSEYKTKGAVAFDLITREDTIVPAEGSARIPSNLVVETPEEYMLILDSRSSMPIKKPGLIAHVGIIDQDYCGANDELLFQVQNVSKKDILIKRGESIGQAVFIRIVKAEFEEVAELAPVSRGGFGSTDKMHSN